MGSVYDIDVLQKQPSESRLYDFKFAPNMAVGESITAVNTLTCSPSTGLTMGSPTFSGTLMQVRLSGGTDGQRYKIETTVTTSFGNILENEGYLDVKNR